MKRYKTIFLLLFALLFCIAGPATAQLGFPPEDFEVVADEESYFYVIYEGDTTSQHNTQRKAIQAAHNLAEWDRGAEILIKRSLVIRVSHGPPEPINDVQWGMAQEGSKITFSLAFDTVADTAWVRSACISTDQVTYEEWGVPIDSIGHASGSHDYFCNEELLLQIKAQEDSTLHQHLEAIEIN